MNKILVTLLALIGGSCISFAQMETGRVSDTAEDTLRIENEIVAVDTGFYQSVVRYDTVRYNLKMQSVYKKAFQLKKQLKPIERTELGIVIELKFVHSLKAEAPISVTF